MFSASIRLPKFFLRDLVVAISAVPCEIPALMK
jgi:hypothetical protein